MLVQAKNAKGFTLVELIVVITILAILATIGFLSLQGYTSDAKDAKIRANLRTVTSALVNEQAMSNNTIDTYIQTGATYQIATTGTGSAYNGASTLNFAFSNGTGSYFAGEVKPSALRIDATKFFDTPTSATNGTAPKPFAVGAYNLSEVVNGKTRIRPMFQVAGTIKGSAQAAVVEGNYGTGGINDVPGLIAVDSAKVTGATAVTALYNGASNTTIYDVVINGSTTNYPYNLN
ncbi:MAG: type II secretion system protein [Patescibacteria group bacterium]